MQPIVIHLRTVKGLPLTYVRNTLNMEVSFLLFVCLFCFFRLYSMVEGLNQGAGFTVCGRHRLSHGDFEDLDKNSLRLHFSKQRIRNILLKRQERNEKGAAKLTTHIMHKKQIYIQLSTGCLIANKLVLRYLSNLTDQRGTCI